MISTKEIPGCQLNGCRKDTCDPEECKTCGWYGPEAARRKTQIQIYGLRRNGTVNYLPLPKRSKPE